MRPRSEERRVGKESWSNWEASSSCQILVGAIGDIFEIWEVIKDKIWWSSFIAS